MSTPAQPDLKKSHTLYIGDLEKQIDESMLYSIFSQFGQIQSLRIMKDLSSKLSRGFAFVTYGNQEEAERAKNQANHMRIVNKPIRIAWKKNIREISPENNLFVKQIPKDANENDF
jgi:RNA recognition motif-containing protein